jgi:membrane associated rhomboid family serine protease
MFPLRDDRPTYSAPIVTTLLIIACALVFLFDGLVPAHLRLSSFVTSMFLHGGWSHIIGNMLFLWAFGKSLEDAMGHSKFLAFYFIGGIVAGIVQVFFNIGSSVPTVGASGAIAAVMGAYLIKFPRAKIHTLFFLIFFVTVGDIPAAFILIYWFAFQVLSGYGSIAHTSVMDGGVAFFAHIGGFIAGMILVQIMGTRNRYLPRRDIYW